MRRTDDTFRNPKNWDIDGGLPDDIWNTPERDDVGVSWDDIAGLDDDSDNNKLNGAEDIPDIQEYERRHYYTPEEEQAIGQRISAANQKYYQDYEAWFEARQAENQLEQERRKIEELDIPQNIIERYQVLSDLPQGVCVMGGMARSIAREVITGDVEPVRDIDLVNIVDEEGKSLVDNDKLDELAREYMPDDYAFGYGIKNEKLTNYFGTRDFTINQCLIRDGKLLVTRQAYDDFQENIIRPTKHELRNEGGLSSRILMKALMLKVVITEITSSVVTLEDIDLDFDRVRKFDVALTLNKMMSRGARAACAFTRELAEWKIIHKDFSGKPMHTAIHLLSLVRGFEFRSVDGDSGQEDEMYDFDDDLLKYYRPSGSRGEDVFDGYDDLWAGNHINMDDYERTSEMYTSDEYGWINSHSVDN